MDKAEIEKIILEVLGNPEAGSWRDSTPAIAHALFKALNPEEKEERVIKPKEVR